jgi:hypothetical protein
MPLISRFTVRARMRRAKRSRRPQAQRVQSKRALMLSRAPAHAPWIDFTTIIFSRRHFSPLRHFHFLRLHLPFLRHYFR